MNRAAIHPACLPAASLHACIAAFAKLLRIIGLAAVLATGALAATDRVAATLYWPVSGSALNSAVPWFAWNGTGAPRYQLHIGNSPGTHDLGVWETENGGVAVHGLPADGRTLYVTLWTALDEGGWVSTSSQVAAFREGPAIILSPSDGSRLLSPQQDFQWTDVGADRYQLHLGTAPGLHDLGYWDVGNSTRQTVYGTPTDGRTVYVTLWSAFDDHWISASTTYLAANVVGQAAQITSPPSGSTLTPRSAHFTWNDVHASRYQLHAGSTPGAHDLGYWDTTFPAVGMSDLPTDGSTIYMTLWSLFGSQWLAAPPVTYKASLSGTPAVITFPSAGTTLTTTGQSFFWSDTGADRYQLHIGTSVGGHDIGYWDSFGYMTSVGVSGLPNDGGTLYATLWSLFGNQWVSSPSVMYKATLFVKQAAVIAWPAAGSTAGPSWLEVGWMNAHADRYQVHAGSTPGAHDLAVVDATSTDARIRGLPQDGRTFYVTLYSAFGSEWLSSAPVEYKAFLGGQPARLTYPLEGDTLGVYSQMFVWNDVGATSYQLQIGTSPGLHDVGYWDTSSRSVTAFGLPSTGDPLYVTLWSQQSGGWVSSSASFKAGR